MCLDTKTKDEKIKERVSDVLTWNKKVPNTQIEKFRKIIEDKYNLQFRKF